MEKLYTEKVQATGGREGRVKSSDGKLDVALSMARELGGSGGEGTNPEQLFAAGYAACFESSIQYVARQQGEPAIKDSSVTASVDIGKLDGAGFGLALDLRVSLPGLDRAQAERLIAEAHKVCPYSNATRGNMQVNTTLV